MTIDAHQHFWHYHPAKDAWITDDMKEIQRDFLPIDLREIFLENKIDGCVTVQADQSENETLFLVEQATKNDFIKGVVGWVDLCANSIEERLDYFSRFKVIKGFRHVVQAEPDDQFILRSDFSRGISLLEKYNFSYDLLIQPRHLEHAAKLVAHYPNQKFVIDHLAKPFIKDQLLNPWKKDIGLISKHKNVYCKLSGLVTEADWKNWKPAHFIPYLDVVVDSFGIDRVMYGSDWPVCLLAAPYNDQLSMITQYLNAFSSGDKEKMRGLNAIHFYNL